MLSPGLNVCTTHVLMRFCHLSNSSFVFKAKEGRHIRMFPRYKLLLETKPMPIVGWCRGEQYTCYCPNIQSISVLLYRTAYETIIPSTDIP